MNNVRVEIYDQTYSLRAELDPEYVQELARYVDQKMRSVAATVRTADSLRAAVLASLNMADELFTARKRIAELEGELTRRTERCLALVEEALQKSA